MFTGRTAGRRQRLAGWLWSWMAADGRADKRLECGAVERGEEEGGRTGKEQVAQAGWKYVRVRDDLIFLGLCRNEKELFSTFAVVGLEGSEREAGVALEYNSGI